MNRGAEFYRKAVRRELMSRKEMRAEIEEVLAELERRKKVLSFLDILCVLMITLVTFCLMMIIFHFVFYWVFV